MKLFVYVLALLGGLLTDAQPSDPIVVLRTDFGEIRVLLHAESAPLTVANFLRYVDEDLWGGATVYRTVTLANDRGEPAIEVIQGGLNVETAPVPAISHESTRDTGLKHLDGTISMARGDVGTASSEFFICIGDQPGLDYGAERNPDGQGFAVFGQVISGMNVVRKIHRSPAEGNSDSEYTQGQIITKPVKIYSIHREKPG